MAPAAAVEAEVQVTTEEEEEGEEEAAVAAAAAARWCERTDESERIRIGFGRSEWFPSVLLAWMTSQRAGPLGSRRSRAAPAQRGHLVRVHRREEEVVVRAWRPRLVAHGELVDGEGEKLGTPGRSTTRAMATAAPSSSAAASSAPSVRAPPAASAGCPSVRASANGDAAAVTVRRFPTAPTKAGCLANHDPRRAALLRAGLPYAMCSS